MASDLTYLKGFFEHVAGQSSYDPLGFDFGSDDVSSAVDSAALNPETTVDNATANYFGFDLPSAQFLKGIMGQVNPQAGQSGLLGNNPMQGQVPGIGMAAQAPVQGVNVYLGAPQVQSVHVAGSEYGAQQTAAPTASGSGINVNATIGGDKTKEPTSADKLDEAVKAAREEVPDGYKPQNWQRIVNDAEAAAQKRAEANDTAVDQEFASIMREFRKVPPRDFTEKTDENGNVVGKSAEQKKADYARALSGWYAENIHGVEDAAERTRLVDDVAGKKGVGSELKYEKDKKTPKSVRAFVAQEDIPEHGLKKGDKIYYDTKKKGWFSEANRRGVDKPIKGIEADGTGKFIKLGGGSDYLEVEAAGIAEGKPGDDGHAPLYDRFKLHGSEGKQSSAIRSKHAYLYRDGAGDWYTKDEDGEFTKIHDGNLVGGRYYANDPGVSIDPAHAEDPGALMDAVGKGSAALSARSGAIDKAEKENAGERVAKVQEAFDEALGDSGRGKLGFYYTPGFGVDITCRPEDCDAVYEAMGGKPAADGATKEEKKALEAKRSRIDAILKDLPDGADVFFNRKADEGYPEALELGDRPISALAAALRRETPQTVAIEGDGEIDLSDAEDKDAAYQEIKEIVDANVANGEIENVESVKVDRKVIFPDETQEKDVRAIARRLGNSYGAETPVEFAKAVVGGEEKAIGVGGEYPWLTEEDKQDAIAAFDATAKEHQSLIEKDLDAIEAPETDKEERLEILAAFGRAFRAYRSDIEKLGKGIDDPEHAGVEAHKDKLREYKARYEEIKPHIEDDGELAKAGVKAAEDEEAAEAHAAAQPAAELDSTGEEVAADETTPPAAAPAASAAGTPTTDETAEAAPAAPAVETHAAATPTADPKPDKRARAMEGFNEHYRKPVDDAARSFSRRYNLANSRRKREKAIEEFDQALDSFERYGIKQFLPNCGVEEGDSFYQAQVAHLEELKGDFEAKKTQGFAKDKFDEGFRFYSKGKYDEAKAAFVAADKALPHDTTKDWIAKCDANLVKPKATEVASKPAPELKDPPVPTPSAEPAPQEEVAEQPVPPPAPAAQPAKPEVAEHKPKAETATPKPAATPPKPAVAKDPVVNARRVFNNTYGKDVNGLEKRIAKGEISLEEYKNAVEGLKVNRDKYGWKADGLIAERERILEDFEAKQKLQMAAAKPKPKPETATPKPAATPPKPVAAEASAVKPVADVDEVYSTVEEMVADGTLTELKSYEQEQKVAYEDQVAGKSYKFTVAAKFKCDIALARDPKVKNALRKQHYTVIKINGSGYVVQWSEVIKASKNLPDDAARFRFQGKMS